MSNENQLQRFPNERHGFSRLKNFHTEVNSDLTDKILSTEKENKMSQYMRFQDKTISTNVNIDRCLEKKLNLKLNY